MGIPHMKKIFAAAAIAASFSPIGVLAQERLGDAALGALSGAVVLGPIGAVAGGAVGYFAGPDIARSWGLQRYDPPPRQRSTRRSATSNVRQEAGIRAASAQGDIQRDASTPSPVTRRAAE